MVPKLCFTNVLSIGERLVRINTNFETQTFTIWKIGIILLNLSLPAARGTQI